MFDKFLRLLYTISVVQEYVRVAQLDRVTAYEPVDRGFESLRAHQRATLSIFYHPKKEVSNHGKILRDLSERRYVRQQS